MRRQAGVATMQLGVGGMGIAGVPSGMARGRDGCGGRGSRRTSAVAGEERRAVGGTSGGSAGWERRSARTGLARGACLGPRCGQDLADGCGLLDERDDPHRRAAVATGRRAGLVDGAQQLRPGRHWRRRCAVSSVLAARRRRWHRHAGLSCSSPPTLTVGSSSWIAKSPRSRARGGVWAAGAGSSSPAPESYRCAGSPSTARCQVSSSTACRLSSSAPLSPRSALRVGPALVLPARLRPASRSALVGHRAGGSLLRRLGEHA